MSALGARLATRAAQGIIRQPARETQTSAVVRAVVAAYVDVDCVSLGVVPAGPIIRDSRHRLGVRNAHGAVFVGPDLSSSIVDFSQVKMANGHSILIYS